MNVFKFFSGGFCSGICFSFFCSSSGGGSSSRFFKFFCGSGGISGCVFKFRFFSCGVCCSFGFFKFVKVIIVNIMVWIVFIVEIFIENIVYSFC